MTNENLYEHKCAHLPCGCPVESVDDYCSEWCERSVGSTDCGCGHVECRAEA